MECWDRRREEYQDARRRARGCARADLPEVDWSIGHETFASSYHGRSPLRLSVLRSEFGSYSPRLAPTAGDNPPESPEDGCPGAWYRSPFAVSVSKYLRQSDANGGRVENLLLRDADRFVIEAVTHYERESARHQAHWYEVDARKAEDDAKRREKGQRR